MRKKMYIVKYEVIATSIKRAIKTRGIIYEVSVAEEKFWPPLKDKKTGFKPKK